MKALYYQCPAGISGDMHLGAMLALGVPEEYLRTELSRLGLGEEFRLEFESVTKMGIAGIKATVHCKESVQHGHGSHHSHAAHRHYRDIRRLIEAAGFSAAVESTALAIFRALGEAEAKIHNQPLESIHFHEVGAVDSIVDIVAAAIAVDYLGVDTVLCSAVEAGGGFVECAHGRYPVPAPATTELLAGVPCTYDGVQAETTTPTGAAILKTLVNTFKPGGEFTADRVAYGIGQSDFPVPNVLRVMLGEYSEPAHNKRVPEQGQFFRIEANIDDMSPEGFEPLMETLLSEGASDVYFSPITMKKSRPATCISVLCNQQRVDHLADVLLQHSTTIGVRIHAFDKKQLPRQQCRITTSLGDVGVKIVTTPDQSQRWKVEHDDVKKLSRQHQIRYLDARQTIEKELTVWFSSRNGKPLQVIKS